MSNFRFDNAIYDDHFKNLFLEAKKYPTIQFSGYITNWDVFRMPGSREQTANISGRLTIKGVSKRIQINGKTSHEHGQQILVCPFTLRPLDYNIPMEMPEKVELVVKFKI